MKKAYELAVLCSCDVGLIIFNQKNKMFQFTSSDMSTILNKYSTHTGEYEILSAKDLESVIHFFFFFFFIYCVCAFFFFFFYLLFLLQFPITFINEKIVTNRSKVDLSEQTSDDEKEQEDFDEERYLRTKKEFEDLINKKSAITSAIQVF